MKLFSLKKNILTNPIGWGQDTVKTKWRYRFLQLFTIIMAVLLFKFFTVLLDVSAIRPLDWTAYFCFGLILSVAAVIFPLCYLRALRHIVLKQINEEKTQINSDDSEEQ